MQPTDTQAQAIERVEELIQEAFAQLPAGATLKRSSGEDELPCDDTSVPGPAGRISVERTYHIERPPGDDWPADQALPTLVGYWQQRGYQVHDDGRTLPDPRYVVQTPDDYYTLIDVYTRGAGNLDLYLSGTSPCIWPDGTPDAQ